MNEKPEALRWDVGDESSPGMYTHPDGDWVRYADYKSLHTENQRLRGLLTEAKDLAWSFGADSLRNRIDAALRGEDV